MCLRAPQNPHSVLFLGWQPCQHKQHKHRTPRRKHARCPSPHLSRNNKRQREAAMTCPRAQALACAASAVCSDGRGGKKSKREPGLASWVDPWRRAQANSLQEPVRGERNSNSIHNCPTLSHFSLLSKVQIFTVIKKIKRSKQHDFVQANMSARRSTWEWIYFPLNVPLWMERS